MVSDDTLITDVKGSQVVLKLLATDDTLVKLDDRVYLEAEIQMFFSTIDGEKRNKLTSSFKTVLQLQGIPFYSTWAKTTSFLAGMELLWQRIRLQLRKWVSGLNISLLMTLFNYISGVFSGSSKLLNLASMTFGWKEISWMRNWELQRKLEKVT